ncbi:MAG: hypothetical protein ACFFER_01725 [Candidatus Thorarchaeota archaeon]
MGDVFLTYDDKGRGYFRRLVYVNIAFYIMMGLAAVFLVVDITILVLAILLSAGASILYAFHFIRRNPPRGPEEIEY